MRLCRAYQLFRRALDQRLLRRQMVLNRVYQLNPLLGFHRLVQHQVILFRANHRPLALLPQRPTHQQFRRVHLKLHHTHPQLKLKSLRNLHLTVLTMASLVWGKLPIQTHRPCISLSDILSRVPAIRQMTFLMS